VSDEPFEHDMFEADTELQPGASPDWLTVLAHASASHNTDSAQAAAQGTPDQLAVNRVADECRKVGPPSCDNEPAAVEEERQTGNEAAAVSHSADEAEREETWQARLEAVERQDDDYRALVFWLDFCGRGLPGYDDDLDDTMRIDLGEFSDDDERNATAAEILKGEIDAALSGFSALYRDLGLVRADNLGWVGCDGEPSGAPAFFLVHSANDVSINPDILAEFAERRITSQAVPGAVITVKVISNPINATIIFERAQAHGLLVGEWGQDHATPELAPAPGESREDWLGRVAMPAEDVRRTVGRRLRSGGNLDLFKAAGAAAGRVARLKPIQWVIPGLLPRGYVSLLVGTKQAGKSTLLGEMLAVISSESAAPRTLLGVQIEHRGSGVLVSGEDGLDFIASRNAYYELVHGPSDAFAFVTAELSWHQILTLIEQIDDVDLIGVDPMRAVMPGNEDSSEATSQFLDELNAMAQRKNCAIVLVHHLSKASVRSLSAMLPAVRGSGAITDRPRMVIGMIDRGSGVTEIGIIKHNIPPSEQLWGEVNVGRLFRRDKATLTLVPFEPSSERANLTVNDSSTLDAILAAVREQNARGQTLRRTGRSELFELRLPQLSGLSRSSIREGVNTLLAAGRLSDGADGLQALGSDCAS